MTATFGKRLRAVRGWRDISQSELAEQVGVPPPLISRIESGIVLPGTDLEEKIRQVLNWDETLRQIQEKAQSEAKGTV